MKISIEPFVYTPYILKQNSYEDFVNENLKDIGTSVTKHQAENILTFAKWIVKDRYENNITDWIINIVDLINNIRSYVSDEECIKNLKLLIYGASYAYENIAVHNYDDYNRVLPKFIDYIKFNLSEDFDIDKIFDIKYIFDKIKEWDCIPKDSKSYDIINDDLVWRIF